MQNSVAFLIDLHRGFVEKVDSFGACFSGQFYLVHLLTEARESDHCAV